MDKEEVKQKAKNMVEKMRPMDYMLICLLIFVLIILGFITVGKKFYSPSPVENEGKVSYEIFFQNVKISGDERENPFVVGEETFVTVRNQPHAKLKITDVKHNRRMVMIPTGRTDEPYVLVDDKTNPLGYDILVTVEDNGKFTNDGIVSGGVKIKKGLPITLEAPLYRYDGYITDVKILNLENSNDE